MKHFKGTPGAFSQDGFNLLAVIAEVRPNAWLKIADCRINDETDIEIEKANCKLFGASKQMLEALQELMRFESAMNCGADHLQYPDNFLKSIKKAKAALSAALD